MKPGDRILELFESGFELSVLFCLLLDLHLLLFDGVDQRDRDAIVLHTFDLAVFVVDNEERIDFGNVLRAKTNVAQATGLPIEGNRAQTIDDIQTGTILVRAIQ